MIRGREGGVGGGVRVREFGGVDVVEEMRGAQRRWRGAEVAERAERDEEYLILMRERRRKEAGAELAASERSRGTEFEAGGWQRRTPRTTAGDGDVGGKRPWQSQPTVSPPSVSYSALHGPQHGPALKRLRQQSRESDQRPHDKHADVSKRQLERYFRELQCGARARSVQPSTPAYGMQSKIPSNSGGLHGFLRRREVGAHHCLRRQLCGNQIRNCRKMYEWIVPDNTHEAVEDCPAAHLRRFTDDGKLLLGFSVIGNTFMTFRYKGGTSTAVAECAVRRGAQLGQQRRQQQQRDAGGDPNVFFTARGATIGGDSEGGGSAAAPSAVRHSPVESRQGSRDRQTVSFGDYFEAALNVRICTDPEILCKDFCINLMNGEMVLLVSYALPGENVARDGAAAARGGVAAGGRAGMGGPEADAGQQEPPSVPGLPSYGRLKFHILRLSDGTVTDTFTMYNSFVNLAHNGGVHVMRDMILILNLRMQKIQILHLRPGGTFVAGMCIGPHCFEDDDLVLRTHHEEESRLRATLYAGRAQTEAEGAGASDADGVLRPPNRQPGDGIHGVDIASTVGERAASQRPQQDAQEKRHDGLLSGLKQRLMAYILRDAQARDRMTDRKDAVRSFYSNFDFLSRLYFTRAQFLNRHHILLRLSGIEGIASRTSDAAQQNAYFVLYDFVHAEVKGFFRNTDENFLKIVEQNISQLSLPAGASPWVQLASVCDGLRKRCTPDGASSSINTIKRALYSLPPSPMSYCCSPYLDRSMFQYDEKMISTADRPRPCAEHPVKFLLKSRPGIMSFKLSAPFNTVGASDGRGKKLVAYIFHPVFPFVLSIVHGGAGMSNVVSFHVR